MLNPYYNKTKIEAGCDEAGRGCLAGPVFAAAVILPKGYKNELLNDSKKLTEQQRNFLREEIENKALAWSVAYCMQTEIDEINILNASILAMHKAVSNLKIKPEFLLIDGNRFKPYKNIAHKCFIKGDGIYASIAAASVLAKTHRDEYMLNLHHHFPQYKWNKNKAYATAEHIQAIKTFGYCEHHRKSFHLKPKQLVLEI
ncbi:MAG TPA: ribonuclease HII [Bacteroidia bacterium]|nr:ribonuclease HII [Bacteroidia bacterium]HNU33455.1 ribonuclease HII [Bacteroidia bacterium]